MRNDKRVRTDGFGAMAAVIFVLVLSHVCSGIEARELAAICKAMEDSIFDISVAYEWEHVPPMRPDEIKGKSLLINKGPWLETLVAERPFLERFVWTRRMTVMDENGRCHDEHSVTSYNNGTMTYFSEAIFPSDGNVAEEREAIGTIAKDRPGGPSVQLTPIGFSVARLTYDGMRVPLSERLSDEGFVRVVEVPDPVNGFGAVAVEFKHHVTNVVLMKVYFAQNHGYTPIRYEWMNPPGKAKWIADVNSLEKTTDGLWFPSSGTLRVAGEERIERFRCTRPIVLNQGMSEKVFEAAVFPPGTRVSDRISGKEYVVKPTQGQLDEVLPK